MWGGLTAAARHSRACMCLHVLACARLAPPWVAPRPRCPSAACTSPLTSPPPPPVAAALMLVVMTYNVGIILAVCGGFAVGTWETGGHALQCRTSQSHQRRRGRCCVCRRTPHVWWWKGVLPPVPSHPPFVPPPPPSPVRRRAAVWARGRARPRACRPAAGAARQAQQRQQRLGGPGDCVCGGAWLLLRGHRGGAPVQHGLSAPRRAAGMQHLCSVHSRCIEDAVLR